MQAGDSTAEATPAGERATILIVDDDTTARLMLSAILGPVGARIVFAAGASEVRARLPLINPDVIVCDVVMEGMTGDEFFRWLKRDVQWRHVPVVAVTNLDSARKRAEMLKAGAESVLSKPCDPEELRAHVHAALRTRRAFTRLSEPLSVDVFE